MDKAVEKIMFIGFVVIVVAGAYSVFVYRCVGNFCWSGFLDVLWLVLPKVLYRSIEPYLLPKFMSDYLLLFIKMVFFGPLLLAWFKICDALSEWHKGKHLRNLAHDYALAIRVSEMAENEATKSGATAKDGRQAIKAIEKYWTTDLGRSVDELKAKAKLINRWE